VVNLNDSSLVAVKVVTSDSAIYCHLQPSLGFEFKSKAWTRPPFRYTAPSITKEFHRKFMHSNSIDSRAKSSTAVAFRQLNMLLVSMTLHEYWAGSRRSIFSSPSTSTAIKPLSPRSREDFGRRGSCCHVGDAAWTECMLIEMLLFRHLNYKEIPQHVSEFPMHYQCHSLSGEFSSPLAMNRWCSLHSYPPDIVLMCAARHSTTLVKWFLGFQWASLCHVVD